MSDRDSEHKPVAGAGEPSASHAVPVSSHASPASAPVPKRPSRKERRARKRRYRTALRWTGGALIILAAVRLVALCVLAGAALWAGPGAVARAFSGVSDVAGFETGELTAVELVTVWALEAALSLLQLAAGALARRLAQGEGRAESCQVLAIALAGLGCISWIVGALSGVTSALVMVLSVAQVVVLPGLLYLFSHRLRESAFWTGIKREAGAEEARRPLVDVVQRYALSDEGKLVPAGDADEATAVEFLSLDEFEEARERTAGAHLLARNARSIRHCTANTFGDSVFGTVRVPSAVLSIARLPFSEDVRFAFQLTAERLVIISDDPAAHQLMGQYTLGQMIEKRSPAAVFFELLEFLVLDNGEYLLDLSDRLGKLEGNAGAAVNEVPRDFDAFVSSTRSRLHLLSGFYRQLGDLADNVATSPSDALPDAARELFRALAGRAGRLDADAQGLSLYALQIRDTYRADVELRQNKVMTLLTIVTTIFMPLTLITGWYGMNFDVMPELHFRYGYYVVGAVSVALVTVEIIVFKRRKWF